MFLKKVTQNQRVNGIVFEGDETIREYSVNEYGVYDCEELGTYFIPRHNTSAKLIRQQIRKIAADRFPDEKVIWISEDVFLNDP